MGPREKSRGKLISLEREMLAVDASMGPREKSRGKW